MPRRSCAPLFSRQGWAVASINYRYSHQALFPGALHDVKEAVRFFRANAHEFGIDPQRIAVAGGSAGGHLSMLVAHTGDSAAGASASENSALGILRAHPSTTNTMRAGRRAPTRPIVRRWRQRLRFTGSAI